MRTRRRVPRSSPAGASFVDSITDYRPTDLRRHLTTFARFLRETNTIAYLLVHPTARPDAVADARGRFATVSTPPVRRFRVGVSSLLEQPAARHSDRQRPPDRRHPPCRRPDPRPHRPVGFMLAGGRLDTVERRCGHAVRLTEPGEDLADSAGRGRRSGRPRRRRRPSPRSTRTVIRRTPAKRRHPVRISSPRRHRPAPTLATGRPRPRR